MRGMALYHVAFGFAGAYRRMIVARDMRGVLTQRLMLALTAMLFTSLLAAGAISEQDRAGALHRWAYRWPRA